MRTFGWLSGIEIGNDSELYVNENEVNDNENNMKFKKIGMV